MKRKYYAQGLVKIYNVEHPEWYDRYLELHTKGLEDSDIAALLNSEGYKSRFGKRVSADMLRCYRFNLKKRQKGEAS